MATPRASEHRDLEQRFRNLESRLRELSARVLQRPKFEVSAGDLTIRGGDLVVNGGDFLLLDTDGSTVFRLGPQEHGDRGVSIFRDDGTRAITVKDRLPDAPVQSLEVWDASGNRILADSEFGSGMDAPWFPLHPQPYSPASAAVMTGPHGLEGPAVTSGTFTTTHIVELPRQNQQSRWRFEVKASDTTTSGEVRIIRTSDGVALNKYLQPAWTGVRADGSTGYTAVDPGAPLLLPGGFAELVRLEVQVRRTAGAGSLTCAVPFAYGYQPTY